MPFKALPARRTRPGPCGGKTTHIKPMLLYHDYMKTKSAILTALASCLLVIADHCALGQDWIQVTNFSAYGLSIAASADGSKLVALPYLGGIYSSTNGGATWIWVSNSLQFSLYAPIAASADGSKLAAASRTGGAIYTSTNAGYSWTSNSVAGFSGWYSIASSADGSKLLAAPYNPGPIFTSADAGTTWRSNNVPITTWYGVASSADGNKLAAADPNNGAIYTSTNSGTNWILHSTSSNKFIFVASSADGNELVAGAYPGPTYTSTDAGTTWISNNIPPSSQVYCVACSADGNKLVAADTDRYGGPIYTSTNGGATWTSNNLPLLGWSSLVSSADGTKLAAAVGSAPEGGGGSFYISQTTPTPTLSLTSSAGNAIISWVIPSLDFTLQQNFDLTTPNWTDVTNAPVLNLTNLQNEVTLPLSSTNTFYRLRSSP